MKMTIITTETFNVYRYHTTACCCIWLLSECDS